MLKNKLVELSRIIDSGELKKHFELLKNDLDFIANEHGDYFSVSYDLATNWDKEFFEMKVRDTVVGLVWLERTRRSNAASLHLVVFPEHRRKGFGINAKWLITEYGFEELGLNAMRSNVYAYNKTMLEINRKCMIETGYVRDSIFHRNKFWDLIHFVLNQKEFQEFKSNHPEFFS